MTARGTIYRDTENGKIAGVIAGLSNHFGWNVTYARIITVVVSIFFAWLPVVVAGYALAAWLLDPMPRTGVKSAGLPTTTKLDDIGRDLGLTPTYEPSPTRNRFVDVRDRFSRLEQRLRSLEKVVTSREFQMDRELRKSGQA